MLDDVKYNKVILGSESRPLPVWDSKTGEVHSLAGPQSIINFYSKQPTVSKSGKIEVESDADGISAGARIYGELLRNLPSRSLLPHLVHELTERDPERVNWDKHSFIAGYVGAPSTGKSFMIKLLGRMTHPKGPLYLNCKDKDMEVLFSETVFDTSAANKERAAIDAKIMQGNQGGEGLSEKSVNLLETVLGDAFEYSEVGDNNLITIDWNAIKVAGNTVKEQEHQKDVLKQILSQVCQNEGIEITSDFSQIGITTRDGIAIRAADPNSADYGRPILLDELNRAKRGTLQKLYEYFALLSDPKVQKFEVIGGDNRPFTFYRKNLPQTYRLNFTGNPNVRGMGSASLDRPLQSRFGTELDIRTVPDPALQDYADRIAQSLTGVPLMQIYYSSKDYFDGNPEMLAEVAMKYRETGMTAKEIGSIPEEERLNINNAQRIIQLSEQLAEFFDGLRPIVDPQSQVNKGSGVRVSSEYEEYLEGIEIDLRLVTKLLEKASVQMPTDNAVKKTNYAAFMSSNDNEEVAVEDGQETKLQSRGQRLEAYIQDWLLRVIGPPDAITRNIPAEDVEKLMDVAIKHASNCGIGDPKLREAKKGGVLSLSELYDFDMLHDPEERFALVAQHVLDNGTHLDWIKEADIVSVQEVLKNSIKALAKDPKNLEDPDNDAHRYVPILNLDKAKNDNLFDYSIAIDSALSSEHTRPMKGYKLLPVDQLFAMIAMPETRSKAIRSLWNENLIGITGVDPKDEAARIASGLSSTGFAMTTVLVRDKGEDKNAEPVHILQYKDQKILVMTRAIIDTDLRRIMHTTGIELINPDAEGAAEYINQIITDILETKTDLETAFMKRKLAESFMMRNGYARDVRSLENISLGQLLAGDKALDAVCPIDLMKYHP